VRGTSNTATPTICPPRMTPLISQAGALATARCRRADVGGRIGLRLPFGGQRMRIGKGCDCTHRDSDGRCGVADGGNAVTGAFEGGHLTVEVPPSDPGWFTPRGKARLTHCLDEGERLSELSCPAPLVVTTDLQTTALGGPSGAMVAMMTVPCGAPVLVTASTYC
jgi:hypothetical protein